MTTITINGQVMRESKRLVARGLGLSQPTVYLMTGKPMPVEWTTRTEGRFRSWARPQEWAGRPVAIHEGRVFVGARALTPAEEFVSGWCRWVHFEHIDNIEAPHERAGFEAAAEHNDNGGGSRPTMADASDHARRYVATRLAGAVVAAARAIGGAS